MAMGLLQRRLDVLGLSQSYRVVSAGTWAMVGHGTAPYAIQVMAERRIDLRSHRAQDVDRALIDKASLVLVMTASHREAIVAEFPEAAGKTYLMSEMVDKQYDIADPYGASMMHYAYCAEDLESLIDTGFDRILSLATDDVLPSDSA